MQAWRSSGQAGLSKRTSRHPWQRWSLRLIQTWSARGAQRSRGLAPMPSAVGAEEGHGGATGGCGQMQRAGIHGNAEPASGQCTHQRRQAEPSAQIRQAGSGPGAPARAGPPAGAARRGEGRRSGRCPPRSGPSPGAAARAGRASAPAARAWRDARRSPRSAPAAVPVVGAAEGSSTRSKSVSTQATRQ